MSEKHTHMDQRRAPIHEALENFRRMRVVPFDVPGHKRGRGNPELTKFLARQSVPPGIRYPGSGRAGCGCIWSGTCFSYGGRHYQLGTEYGADCLQTGG